MRPLIAVGPCAIHTTDEKNKKRRNPAFMPINLYNPHLVFWEDLVSTTRNSDIMHNTKMRQGENKVLPVEKEPWKEDLVVQIKRGSP
jgi:hypothetical protein